jgi:adenine deaminase
MSAEEVKAARISGNIVDVISGEIFPGTMQIRDGRIEDIRRNGGEYDTCIIPGLVDSHVHIESSMLVPSEFARLAVRHGTVATVSDPHEIANVLGLEGVRYMVENGKSVPFKFFFGAPSCVPATSFETAGAVFEAGEIETLLKDDGLLYLSEMMNFPGVIFRDQAVMARIEVAARLKKPVDGHAPGVAGEDLRKYVSAGISTDHECTTIEEAREKIGLGMKVIIREGSAAKSLETLLPLLREFPDMCMLCSDDRHPDDLVAGHVNQLVRRALELGYDRLTVLRCASLVPVRHYGLPVGLLRKGDPADFAVIDNFDDFNILETWIDGKKVAEKGKSLIGRSEVKRPNNFMAGEKKIQDFSVKAGGKAMNVIEARDGQLLTRKIEETPRIVDGLAVPDPARDLLKLTVVNRYSEAPPAVAFIRGFGLKRGAIAASVGHDSHNILAVGAGDEELARAVNLVISNKGGLAVVDGSREEFLPLPVAGLMTDEDGFSVAEKYSRMTELARMMGSAFRAPFMTLSFMALLVIPEVKLSDKGLFDGSRFAFMDLFPEMHECNT